MHMFLGNLTTFENLVKKIKLRTFMVFKDLYGP